MRTINFRGRDKAGKRHYGYLVSVHSPDRLFIFNWRDIGGEATIKDEFFSSIHEIDPETASQFTGLLDRNGKEIWEGDILRRDNFADWVVTWGVAGFAFYNVTDGNHLFQIESSYAFEEREVIGNIWENPELVEAK